ncbi:MAG TPA: rhodanese-like domain-containing protein [Acetobacteraceae bacterium]|jgi:rhodanese-related sulfurtransferase|nr:rhodanese-like domain-containing protein [Acetobacteraceae bacterium]
MTERKTLKSMLAEAESAITRIPVADALAMQNDGRTTFVDLRDPREIERDGTIPGAFRVTRGMLEFWIDPDSPYYKPIFGEPRRFVFFCAMGWRSSLAALTAQQMGLPEVADLQGGLKAWREAGGPVEVPAKQPAA